MRLEDSVYIYKLETRLIMAALLVAGLLVTVILLSCKLVDARHDIRKIKGEITMEGTSK